MEENILRDFWPEWTIEKQLGRGSYGVVYQAVRQDRNLESRAAIKVISIPSDQSEIDSLRSEGLDMRASRTYLQEIVDDFIKEIDLMDSLKGIQNIVSVEDYKVVEKTGEIGWDIYIRMELLTPFNTYVRDRELTEEDVIKLGRDICTALEFCGRRNIIHRDIKPENIFVNDFGDFKLGDFGIARRLENMTGALSQKGTLNFMAPEVMSGKMYDARADLYSLGIVLYRLMNENRYPFMGGGEHGLSYNARKEALDRRMRGEQLPPPCKASPELAKVILRACAYDPSERYASAAEMRQALNQIDGTMVIPQDDRRGVRKDWPAQERELRGENGGARGGTAGRPEETSPRRKSPVPKIIAAVLAVAVLVGGGVFAGIRIGGGRASELSAAQDMATPEPAPTATPEPAPTATPEPAPTATPEPAPTATPEPAPTATPEPAPTATPEPAPTATPEPAPTATPEPVPTATPEPDPAAVQAAAAGVEQLASSGRYTYLYEMPCSALGGEPFAYYDRVMDSYGTVYSNGIGGSAARADNTVPIAEGESWQEYDLNGAYSEIRGRVVMNYEARYRTIRDVYMYIYGDGILLFRSQKVTSGCEPRDFCVDISGVDTLRIVLQGKNMLRLVDCALYEDAGTPTVSSAVEAPKNTAPQVMLGELDWLSASWPDAFRAYDTVTDNQGNIYLNGLGGTDADELAWQSYYLNGEYARVTGRVVLDQGAASMTSEDICLCVYCDGILRYESEPVTAGCEPQDFDVDLTGVKKLRISIQGETMLRLVDCRLMRAAAPVTPAPSDVRSWTGSIPIADEDTAGGKYVYLYQLLYSDASEAVFELLNSVTDNFGTTYSNGLSGTAERPNESLPAVQGQTWQEYELDGTYKQLRGRIVLDYNVRTQVNEDVYVWIYGDGVLLYRSPAVAAGFMPCDFSVDVSNVRTLRVTVQGRYMVRLVDWILCEDPDMPAVSSAKEARRDPRPQVPLAELDWFSGNIYNGAFAIYDEVTDNVGNTYAGGIGGKKANGQSWEEFWLDGEYREMSGRVVLDQAAAGMQSSDVVLAIYGDGALLYQSKALTAGCAPQDFSVDVSGVRVLRVTIEGKSMLRLVDCVLRK